MESVTEHLKEIRSSIPYVALREVWDAFMLEEWFRDHLPERNYLSYAREARTLARRVNWENYSTVFQSAISLYRELAEEFGLPGKNWKDSARRMMKRFMIGRINTFRDLEREENYLGACVEPGDNDLHNVEIATIFALLPPQPEIAAYLKVIKVDYDYDHLHMVTWFSGQLSLGQGKYSRSRPNHSAKKNYERLLNPYSLLWIGAALGEDPEVVLAAGRETEAYKSWSAKCGVVRRAIPFSRIYELALKTQALEAIEEENRFVLRETDIILDGDIRRDIPSISLCL